MFSILDRYVLSHILAAVLLTLLVITGLDLLFTLIDQLSDLTASYGLTDALYYVLLTAPRRIYEHLPSACLIGCLLGLGQLAKSSELTVMRASGISIFRILFLALKPALLLVILAMFLGEYVVPNTERMAQNNRSIALTNKPVSLDLKQGVWYRDNNTFVQIKRLTGDSVLEGLVRYEFNDQQQLVRASYAEQAKFKEGIWQLEQVTNTYFDPRQTRVVKDATEQWNSSLSLERLRVLLLDPEYLSTSELNIYSDYLNEQGLSRVDYEVAFWNKLLQPLDIIALVLLAVSFIFGPLRSSPAGQRLVVGIMLGLVFKLLQDSIEPASLLFGLPAFASVLSLILIKFALGYRLLRRAN